MRLLKRSGLIITAVAACAVSYSVFACTGIQLKSQDGTFISGRTLEFGIPINTVIDVIPRNYTFTGTLPDGSKGMSYNTKYGAVGGSLDNGIEVQDGLNEAGLSVGAFYFPGYAGYSPVTDRNKSKALSPLQFPTWILTQFATVEQVKATLNNVVIVPTVYQAWGLVPPLHYVVYDKAGNSIVIEPINGRLVVYNNPLGVFTNSPTFDWQMTNLRNYINLSPINVSPVAVKGTELQQFSQGSGMHGIPGDFTSPSRFVRAAFFAATAMPTPNAQATVLQVFHILNQFDIPLGAVRDVSSGKMMPEYTMITIVRDPQNLNYYFKSYENQSINVIHLSSFDLNATSVKIISTDQPQLITDVSGSAVDAASSSPPGNS